MGAVTSVRDELEKTFAETDLGVNNKFILIDSKNKESKRGIKFESGKIIDSLTNIGIPLINSLSVLDMVVDKINEYPLNTALKTSDLRKLVSNSLYTLHTKNGVSANAQKCQIWGDLYLRKYGNPEGPIQILHRDGRIEVLNYDLIQNSLIPDAFSEILNIDKSIVLKKILEERT